MSDIDKINHLKEVLNELNLKKARAEGVIESITKAWAEQGITSIDEAIAKAAQLDEEIKRYEESIARLFSELDKIGNWS